MDRDLTPTSYVFNHVPKTGGISLLSVCRRNLPSQEISPHLTEHEIRLIAPDGLEHYRLIAGHFSLITQAKLADSRYRITLLRDPVRKILSTYQFWRVAPDVTPVTSIARTRPFEDFVRYFADSPDVIHNPYTFHFSAIGMDSPVYPADEAALLAQAKRNLAAFDFVGLTEELGESVRQLCRELGWSCPAEIPRENTTGSERLLDQIDPATLDLLRERNRLDLALCEYGRELFGQAGARRTGERQLRPFPLSPAPARQATVQRVSAAWPGWGPAPSLKIDVDFDAVADIEELTAGVLVHDEAGRVVWGTNTLAENHRLQAVAHRQCQVSFEADFQAPPGVYSVTVALAELRLLGLHHHWIDRATVFEVGPGVGKTAPQSVRLRRIASGVGGVAQRHSIY